MTEQPVDAMTEQVWLHGDSPVLPPVPLQHYAPNAHRLPLKVANPAIPARVREQAILDELAAGTLPTADLAHPRKAPDLWLDAEGQTNRALCEIQDGNINAGIACLQAALAFAQNHRHSLTEETAR